MNEELTRKQEPGEETAADLPEGRSEGRRGETARQLIRRAKYASRRKFPAEEKIRIVMEGIRAEVSVADPLRHATPLRSAESTFLQIEESRPKRHGLDRPADRSGLGFACPGRT